MGCAFYARNCSVYREELDKHIYFFNVCTCLSNTNVIRYILIIFFFSIPQSIIDNMASFLECFGEIKYDREVTMVEAKEDEGKGGQKCKKSGIIKKISSI